ncbi:hypothetical protein M0802_013299 [Mischocyttarus mexicanus]|nr:hypothetical protein M0802_013299 [Mischocyttarus mexicanus]
MLVTSAISIGIRFRTTVITQRLCSLIKTYSTSSGSSSGSSSETSSGSSSDSSDSDSDTEKLNKPVKNVSSSLDDLVNNLILLKDKKRLDVAMPVRKNIRSNKPPPKKNVPYEEQLSQAVSNITNNLTENKEKINTELLNMLSSLNKDNSKKNYHENLSKNIENIILNDKPSSSQESENKRKNEEWKYKADIARKLKTENKQKLEQNEMIKEPSHIRNLMKNEAKRKNEIKRKLKTDIIQKLETHVTRKSIFEKLKEPTTTIPELSTWVSLEKKELDLIATTCPQNIFQEMIQWTESGKLWKFPIDNEIGMEKETNVHFTEHVFLERHLKDWCPTSGPVRHFMELVCVGLSKNPYMTVNEKKDHIAWYKEYFKGKKEILLELGAIETTSDTTKQITS